MEEKITDQAEVAEAPEAAPKKSKKKLGIILGVIAVVVVVAGAGFFVWHEQPSFCNAICHTPMDPYLPTYEAEVGTTATDKWGNEVEDSSAMLACVHRVKADATCLSCHVPTLSEQIGEGIGWITGSYEVVDNETYGSVLVEKSLSDLTEASGIDDEAFCLNESCHNMTKEDLIEATSDMERNVHEMPHGEVACSDCHKAHRASVNYCSQCHSDATIPDGWLSTTDESNLTSSAKA